MYYLGSITGASGAYYNDRTGASGVGAFTVPPNTKALYLVNGASGQTGLSFAFSCATGVTSFLNAAAQGAPLGAFGTISGPYRTTPGTNVVVGIYNSVGGFKSVLVFAAPTS